MKKILLMLSLIVIGMFLAGCAPELQDDSDTALVGEAYASKQCAQTAKQCGFINIEEVYNALSSSWGTVNKANQEWNCVDTCREVSLDKHGKCVAGYGYDYSNRLLKSVLSCNIPVKNLVKENDGDALSCLCIN